MSQKGPKLARKLDIFDYFIRIETKNHLKRVEIDNEAWWDVEQDHHQVSSKSHDFRLVKFSKKR